MSLPMIPAAVVSSLLAVALAWRLFRDQPATRRVFLILLSGALLVVPVVCVWLELRLTVGLVGVSLPAVGPVGSPSLFVWLMCSGVIWAGWCMVRLAAAWYAVRRQPGCDHAAVRTVVSEYAGRLRIRAPVRVSISSTGPASTTLGGPLVLLPPAFQQWETATLRAVLAHELVHVARRDDVWINLSRIMAALFWWLPWLGLLPRLLEQAVEESCDDHAAELAGGDQGYLGAVCELARSRREFRQGVPLVGVGLGSTSSLVVRMRRFGRPRCRQLDTRGVYWATLWVLLVLTAIWSLQIANVVPASAHEARLVAVTGRATDQGDLVLTIGLPATRPLTATARSAPVSEHPGTGPPP